jgi:hypothetical protein
MNHLVEYYAERDGVDPMGALRLLAADVRFHLMPVPGVEISGTSLAALRQELSGFVGSPAKHRILLHGDSGGIEFAVGHRVADGVVLGTFVAVAVPNSDGLLATYIGAYFDGTPVMEA